VYFWATSPDSGSFDPSALDPRREIERTLVVEHHVRPVLTGATSPGLTRPRWVNGRVVDTVTGRGVGGVRVLLQRHESGRWVTVTHSWTADHGAVGFAVPRQRPARYRLLVPHQPALVMAATGRPRRM